MNTEMTSAPGNACVDETTPAAAACSRCSSPATPCFPPARPRCAAGGEQKPADRTTHCRPRSLSPAPLRRRLMGQEELLPMAFCQFAGGHRQQRLVEVAGDFITAGVNMRPAHHHQILRVDVITLKQREAIVDNPAGSAAPACVHAADIAPIARRHQQRQTVGGHHAHLLPADGGKHRIGVGRSACGARYSCTILL